MPLDGEYLIYNGFNKGEVLTEPCLLSPKLVPSCPIILSPRFSHSFLYIPLWFPDFFIALLLVACKESYS